MKHYTTIEQSKKLLELGLDVNSADMVWSSVYYDGAPKNGDANGWNCYLDPKTNHFYYADLVESYSYEYNDKKKYPSLPCWSLGALLELMPTFLILENIPCSLYVKKYNQRYEMYYANNGFAPKGIIESNTSIKASYSMVVWLLENGYIVK